MFTVIGDAKQNRSAGSWRDAKHRVSLKNKALLASFQAGQLYQLNDLLTGKTLLFVEPARLPAKLSLFGSVGLNLNVCQVFQQATADSLVCRFRALDRTEWELRWSIEPDAGNLILQTSARTNEPVSQFRLTFKGCDIANHSLVTVSNYGVGRQVSAPWTTKSRDLNPPARYVQPIVALFQGQAAGWFLEGREEKIGPANIRLSGSGQTADVTLVRGFPLKTNTPKLFEVRLRTYQQHWQDAVDPYVDWMEHEVGFVPLEKKAQKWVKNIRSQAYVSVGDFAGLEALAKRLDPAKTLLGRVGGYRPYNWDHNFPNYNPGDKAKQWFKQASELGFHIGAHVNTSGVDRCYPDLIERFRRGFLEIRTDADGKETCTGAGPSHSGRVVTGTKDGELMYWGVPPTYVYSSPANKDWRDYLIEQLRPLVEAGVDMIYLDESMTPCGKFLMDGKTGIQGIIALEKEILQSYPHVVIETEQINPMCARWSSFALTTEDLGHPLGGYIFNRFVKIVPEGTYYQPLDEKHLDEFQSFGFMLPGANNDESWLQIAEAFQEFDLSPASRLPLKPYQLFGYRGPGDVRAYYEKHPNKRGLVVYAPVYGKAPQWFGARVTSVRTWSGPGALRDWAIYQGNTLLGLAPQRTYVFDESVTLPSDRFHVTDIPEDFTLYANMDRRIRPQDIGKKGCFYKITFTGNGELGMYVPDDVLVFLDGEKVPVDRTNKRARVQTAATSDKPSVLLAFRKSDTELVGKWVALPWQQPPRLERKGYVLAEGDDFFNHVGGTAQIIGRLPQALSIRLQGAWGMNDRPKSLGEGVVRINGQEVLHVPPGSEPFKPQPFDADIAAFAGQYVLLEFASDGEVHGPAPSRWYAPQIVVRP